MAVQASAWADLPPRAELHSMAEIQSAHTQLSAPGGPSFPAPRQSSPRAQIFVYALTVVDVASRYREAEPLTSKNSDEVALSFRRFRLLKWPELLQVDPGRLLQSLLLNYLSSSGP